MKKIEMFQELSVKLAVIESKLDKVLDLLSKQQIVKYPNSIGCSKCNLYTCDGTKCTNSGYALSSGSLVDSGTQQVWNKEKPVDCVSTTYIPSGDLSLE